MVPYLTMALVYCVGLTSIMLCHSHLNISNISTEWEHLINLDNHCNNSRCTFQNANIRNMETQGSVTPPKALVYSDVF